tara:strand:+ start:170 stop:367 length:198 start_codon:yes stop_codon:yes gene_type:complete
MKFYFVVTGVEKIKNVIISNIKFVLDYIIDLLFIEKMGLIESNSLIIHWTFAKFKMINKQDKSYD